LRSPECVNGDPDFKEWAHAEWEAAEDVTPETTTPAYYPIDNPDARCGGCGAHPGAVTIPADND
jgi:hypothetical protein